MTTRGGKDESDGTSSSHSSVGEHGTMKRMNSSSPMSVRNNAVVKQNSFSSVGGRPASPSLYAKLNPKARGTVDAGLLSKSPKQNELEFDEETDEFNRDSFVSDGSASPAETLRGSYNSNDPRGASSPPVLVPKPLQTPPMSASATPPSPRLPIRSPSKENSPQYSRKESKTNMGTTRINRVAPQTANPLGNVTLPSRDILDDKKAKRLTTVVLSPTKTPKRERQNDPSASSNDDSGLFVNLMYSERETETMKEIFVLLVRKQPNILKSVILDSSLPMEEMCMNLITMGLITGTIFKLVRYFIEDEYSFLGAGEGEKLLPFELFSEESVAATFLQNVFKRFGDQYLSTFFSDFIIQMVIHEKKQSLELNPAFTEPSELEMNRRSFQRKVTEFLRIIFDDEAVDKMPVPIRTIAGYIHECGNAWKAQGFNVDTASIVGKVIILRYVDQVLAHPEQYIKKAINISSVAKRNLALFQRILQLIVLNDPLGPKEQFFKVFESFTDQHRHNVADYVQGVIVPSTTALTVPSDLNVVAVSELHTMHRILYQNNDILINSSEGAEFKRLLDKLGSYQNKVSFSFLTPNDQKMVKGILKERNEEAFLVTWVEKSSANGKTKHRRLLIVGMNRVIGVTPSGKVSKEGHYLDLLEIRSSDPKEAQLVFKGYTLAFESDSVDDIIDSIRNAFSFSFSTLPDHLQLKLNVTPESRIREPSQTELTPCDGFVGMYRSVCDYYKSPVHVDLCWDLANLKEVYSEKRENEFQEAEEEDLSAYTLDLFKYTNVAPEDSLKESDLLPILHTLRHNTYFTSFVLKSMKLEKKETIQALQELLKSNTTLENLILSGIQGIKDGFHVVLEGLISNPYSNISCLDLSQTKLDDKSANNLAKYLSQTKAEIFYLDVSKTDASQKALVAIFQALNDNPKASSSLRFLSISHNTIGSEGSNTLKQWFQSGNCGNLSVVHMSSIAGINIKPVVEGLISGAVPIQKLDVSCNKFQKGEDLSIFVEYLKVCTLLEELNLASTSIPIETVTKLLTNVSEDLNLDLDLKNNNLGSVGAVEIAKIAYRINSVHSLDLSDNDLGDEGLAELALGLRNNNSIRRLYLNRNFKMGKSKDRARAVDTLIQLVSSDCLIEALHISAKPHSSSSLKQDLIPFISALESNSSLIELGISGHQMGNKGAIAIGKVLQINTHLACLVWDENETGLTGFLNIKYALKINKALKFMPLPVSDIGLLVKELSREDQIKLKVTLAKIEKSIANNISISY
eukprot:TRINITY_DN1857_c0_g1_i1.p1 TRINITY_DN1857_c0_g1~~TRINITY_DN1857_c0_g1_i1.p1  ORF type:complete len:1256 (+),score=475.83 TRINITY_DN1857_c0_g1_i1:207-3974(+)